MEVKHLTNWDDLQPFLPYLERRDIAHNLAIGLITGDHQQEPIMAVAFYRDHISEPLMLLLQTIQEQAVLSVFEELTDLEIQECATLLAKQEKRVYGFIGELPYVEWLSMQYGMQLNLKPKLSMSQRIYQLTQVRPPDGVPGRLRHGQAEERSILIRWASQFAIDAGISMTEEEAEDRVNRLLKDRAIYVWEDEGQMVSIAAATRPGKTNINIALVFTPTVYRKKGYASACVAALSARMLEDRFKTISLYTDLDNPTSNHIYQQIGFEQVLDSKLIHFNKE